MESNPENNFKPEIITEMLKMNNKILDLLITTREDPALGDEIIKLYKMILDRE